MGWWKKIQWQPWYIKLTNWEYWSFNTVYMPIIFYWFYLAIKARSFFFFNASNPTISYGGFLMESKWEIYPLLPKSFTPKTAIIRKNSTQKQILSAAKHFSFPIICKPDMGSRGRGVAIIKNEQEVLQYHQQCPLDFLLQEKVNLPLEAGIFYVRVPGEKTGRITGIVEKEFVTITGDGVCTIRDLLMQNKRFVLQLKSIENLLGNKIDDIPHKGETRLLVPFGNHARGCRFIDSSNRINNQLSQAIDKLCQEIDGFYFGRLDIRFESWAALERGKNFSIIELNGAGSEPTHMYGGNTVFTAWKQIITHWQWLYKVSRANHKLGFPYLTLQQAKAMFAGSKQCDKQLEHFQFKATDKPVTFIGQATANIQPTTETA